MSNYSANALALGVPYYDQGSATQATPPAAAPAGNYSAPAQATPSYMSQLFSNGMPQVQANGIAGANAAGSPAIAGASSAGGSNIDASQYGGSAMTNEILNSLSPVFQQQQRALTDNLANAGIVGGSTAGASQDLATQQITQALGLLAPIQQTANGQQLGAQEFNSGQLQSNNQFNASANQAAQEFNSGQMQTNNQFNASADQAAQQFNATAANGANSTNVGNSLNAANTDNATYNNLIAQIMGYGNTDYLQQQQNEYGLATGAASGQEQAFVPIYQQPQSSPLMQAAAAYAGSA